MSDIEFCEDCISRKAALADFGLAEFHRYDDYRKMRNYLEQLPSVLPKATKNDLGIDAVSRKAVIRTLDSMNSVLDEDRTVEKYGYINFHVF